MTAPHEPAGYPDVPGPDRESSPALATLLDFLLVRHGSAVNGVLMYGSCLRSGNLYDGLVDLYLVVDSYRAAYHSRWLAIGNWLLPPNVFYAEVTTPEGTIRSKYAIVSSKELQRGTSAARFESYLWGRFAQPTRIVFARDGACREFLAASLLQAVATFLDRALPVCPAEGAVGDLWRHALGLSYRTELRSEGGGRAGELASLSGPWFDRATEAASKYLLCDFSLYTQGESLHYRADIPDHRRRLCRRRWQLRGITGKALSVLRLLKALFTFDGGLDYIAWKLERHSGQRVEIPDKVRRRPLLHIWGLMWQLYRRGVFR